MDLSLVSAGDDIKIWDSTNLLQLNQFNPHDQNINSVCWSCDNSFLASASVNTEDVVLTYMNNYDALKLTTTGGCMCVDVEDKSRYMLIAGSDGLISVWDLKSKKKKKTYKGHKGPVTSAIFNKGASYIASGSETGEIIIHNVVTGQGCQPLTAPNVQAIKKVQYSQSTKSLLGSVSDDGSVNLWDCNKQQLVQSLPCHQAPSTGLSFSPINNIFLMSVGLDKRIVCHDLSTKKVIKVINTESPLTSIDLKGDGVTVVVGSTRGLIHQYDLRMSTSPVKTIEAHRSSVQCLQFQKEPVEVSNKSGVAATSKQQLKHRQLPPSPKSNSTSRDMGGTSNVEIKVSYTGVGEDIFSPLREGYQDQSSEEMDYHGSFLRNSNTQSKNSTGTGDGYLGVFSPINDNVGRGSTSSAGLSPLAYSVHTQNNSRNSTGLMDYNRIDTKILNISSGGVTQGGKGDLSTSNQNINNSQQKQVTFMSGETDPYAFLANGSSSSSSDAGSPDMKRPRSANRHLIGMSASPSLPSMHQNDSPGSVASSTNTVRHYQATTPDGVNPQSSLVNNLDSSTHKLPHENGTVRHHTAVPGDMRQFAQIVRSVVQEELNSFKSDVRNVVRDEVDDMVDQLHRDIINLQAEMLRQFQMHQSEMLSLLEHYSVNRDLVSEVERLQEEVRRLKKNF